MLRQDPGLRTVEEGTVSRYGIAMNKHHTYFVRYVNGVLDKLAHRIRKVEIEGSARPGR
jgi:hypothetical protein